VKRLIIVAALAGCPSDPPKTLWLALDGSELKVRLVESEPRPF
jgi:hypothetical protein